MAKETKLKESTTALAVAETSKGAVAIATKPGTRSVTIHQPSEVEVFDIDSANDIGAVQEQQGERRLPIIRVLQSGSPQIKDGMAGYVPGAKEGDFINTATNQIYSGQVGLFIIPARKHLKYVEYIKREKDGTGGGFLAVYEPEDPVVKHAKDVRMEAYGNLFGKLANGIIEDPDSPAKGKEKEISETHYIDAVAVIPDEEGNFPGEFGTMFEASFAFQSSFIKSYNAWENRLKSMTYIVKRRDGSVGPSIPTLWTHVWHIVTGRRIRGAQSWMVPSVMLAEKDDKGVEKDYRDSRLPKDNFLYKQAENLFTELQEGGIDLDFAKDTGGTDGEAQASNTNQGGTDDIPFEQKS